MSRQRKYLIIAALLLLVFGCARAQAQTSSSPSSTDEMQLRIRQLETEMRAMREELTKLKQALPSGSAVVVEQQPVLATVEASHHATQAESRNTQQPETKPAPAERRPAGIELGPVHATPYGTIYFNAFGNSGGTNNADVPLFATPTGTGNTSASVRQTRIGLRLEGPEVRGAKSSGVVEADFFGGFPAIGVGENFGVVRLRLAFARLDWENISLEAGQDWVLFAPVNPVSIASAAIPQMTSAGNSWARMPQIRLERRWMKGKLVWQGAVLAPNGGDFPSGTSAPFLLQPGTSAASRLPYFQSRVSINNRDWLKLKRPGSIGISLQAGRARMANTTGNNQIDSFGLALDWSIPLQRRLTLAGEAFAGRNLAGFQSGVFQGFNPDFAYRSGTTLISGGPRAIGTRGGWTQAGFTPPMLDDHLTLYVSYGLDDPRDEDLVSLTRRDWRLRNQAFAYSFLYKLSAQFSWGIEFRRLETNYLQSGKQADNHLNLGAAFNF